LRHSSRRCNGRLSSASDAPHFQQTRVWLTRGTLVPRARDGKCPVRPTISDSGHYRLCHGCAGMRKYLFADEAGDFEFARKTNVSRYFIVCTVTLENCAVEHALADLRRDLAWRGNSAMGDYFHASHDNQCIRDLVFDLIAAHEMRIDATILEKSKAQSQTRTSHARFYQYAWYFHFRSIAREILATDEELLLTTASLGTKRLRKTFAATVNNVVQQVATRNSWATYFCPAGSDLGLQVADYCTWAIQRKWERNDTRSYDLIRRKVVREYDLWAAGTQHFY
jgi:hypothetical protein